MGWSVMRLERGPHVAIGESDALANDVGGLEVRGAALGGEVDHDVHAVDDSNCLPLHNPKAHDTLSF